MKHIKEWLKPGGDPRPLKMSSIIKYKASVASSFASQARYGRRSGPGALALPRRRARRRSAFDGRGSRGRS
eukprot:3019010-Pyramimonas_sp.AAC.2